LVKKVLDTNKEYHSVKLLGTSALVSGYNSKTGEINLAKVNAYFKGMTEISTQLKKTFDFGSVQHSAILEQDLSELMVLPEFKGVPALTKREQILKWEKDNPGAQVPDFSPIKAVTIKSQVEGFKDENPAVYYLKQKEYDLITGAFEVFSSHSEASQMVSNSLDVEASFYDYDNGVKCRPDLLGETDDGETFLCNYKTILDLDQCNSHIYHLKYDIRAMSELAIVEKYLERPVEHYYFLFQEKKPPFSMRCIEIGNIDKEIAYDEYLKTRNTVLMAIKDDFYPQPTFKIETSQVYRAPKMETF